jgi:hypothetical protein
MSRRVGQPITIAMAELFYPRKLTKRLNVQGELTTESRREVAELLAHALPSGIR